MPDSVVFFLANFKSGGTEWFALRLARGLARRGLRPVFLAAEGKGELLSLAKAEFPLHTLSGHGYSLTGIARVMPALVRYLRREKPHTIISGLPLLNVAMALAVRLAGLKPRLIMVEHMRLCPSGVCPRTLRHRLKRALLARAYVMADEVVSVSRTAAADLSMLGPAVEKRARVIYNPVIPDDFEALRAAPPPHPWLADKSCPTLLAVGRLLPVKDYPTLLRAFSFVRQERPVRLVILGEGTERPALEELIRILGLEQDVVLFGSVPNPFSAMAAADLFVLSSVSEAFGNVLIEALACGTPVVSTDCGGPREILQDGKLGALVPVGDALALAIAIRHALDTPQDREALRKRGLSFSVESAVASYVPLIRGNKRSTAEQPDGSNVENGPSR